MAIPYVQSIDMNDFQLLNFVVHSSGSAPTNASSLGGMMWWDSTNYDAKVYNDNDAAWNSLIQGPASSTAGYIPQWSGSIGNKLSTGLQLLTTVGDPGVDTAIVTDQGIREAINTAIAGGVTYKGAYNANTNTPDLETPGVTVVTGDMYTVTVAGTFFTAPVDVGDVLISETDTPTTEAEWTIVNRNWDETFLELGDTPASYAASAGFMLMVDATPDAVEFVDPSGYGLSNFSNDLYTAAALTKTDDTNVTLTLGGTPATALLQATSLTLGWTGTLAVGRGGTGLSTIAADSVLVTNTANTLVALTVGNGQSIRLNAGGTAWEAFTPSSGIGNHNLLNGTEHPDTTTQAVTRGSLIYGNATPLWDELVVGGATTFLYTDGTDVSWKDVDFADLGTTPTTLSGYGISDTMANFDTAANDGNFAWAGGAFHDGFSDFVGNEHINHTSVDITTAANSGLAGGGDISATRNLVMDINNLTTETTIAGGDFLAFWDITATAATKNITFTNFVTQVQANLSAVAKVVTGDLASGATPTITHNLNLSEFTDIVVQIWRQADNKLVGVEITAATKDTVTVNFGSAAINSTLGDYRFVVTGVQL